MKVLISFHDSSPLHEDPTTFRELSRFRGTLSDADADRISGILGDAEQATLEVDLETGAVRFIPLDEAAAGRKAAYLGRPGY